jgi:UDP-N-acetylmuramyl pentapeptide phosphotransferase/UDP-N-acetylglucosamine-1-phosphate transferase
VGQLLATGIVMIMADIAHHQFSEFWACTTPVGISYAFTLGVIVGHHQCHPNLIDGLDGLAGTIVMRVSALWLLFLYFHEGGSGYGSYAYVAICLIRLAGFYNFHRASILWATQARFAGLSYRVSHSVH